MNIEFIEKKLNEIIKELEKEVMSVLMDENLDKGQTNLHMKPLASTKQILENALDSMSIYKAVKTQNTIYALGMLPFILLLAWMFFI
jgi:hypothetical protein